MTDFYFSCELICTHFHYGIVTHYKRVIASSQSANSQRLGVNRALERLFEGGLLNLTPQ